MVAGLQARYAKGLSKEGRLTLNVAPSVRLASDSSHVRLGHTADALPRQIQLDFVSVDGP